MGSLCLAENLKPATLCNFQKPSTYCAIDNQSTQFHWKRGEARRDIKMPLAKELLLPLAKDEQRKHKLKRLVQHPNSYFMDVKCPGCYRITTMFSHAQTVVVCSGCSTVLCQSTGGRARLTEGCSFRKKSQK